MVCHLRTASSDGSGVTTVINAPAVPNIKPKPNNRVRKHATTMQVTPRSRIRGSTQTGFRMQLLEG